MRLEHRFEFPFSRQSADLSYQWVLVSDESLHMTVLCHKEVIQSSLDLGMHS